MNAQKCSESSFNATRLTRILLSGRGFRVMFAVNVVGMSPSLYRTYSSVLVKSAAALNSANCNSSLNLGAKQMDFLVIESSLMYVLKEGLKTVDFMHVD